MDHFGFALGAITVSVIGGAFLYDYSLDASDKTAPPAKMAPARVAESTPSPTVVADASPAIDKAASSSAARPSAPVITASTATPRPARAIARTRNATPSDVEVPSPLPVTQNAAPASPPPAEPPANSSPASADKPAAD